MAPIPKTIGRYDIIQLVGRGGMGVLYKARDPVLERDVALKMMIVDFTVDPQARERFQREARAVARLQHRNVVTIHELGESEGSPYIVMEFLSGMDLENRVKDTEKPLTLPEKLDIAIQLCEGLGFAHEQGIVHRDIKPGNVRVLEDGTVKILDFGIAKFAQSSVTQSGAVMGTASYMSPEQIMGQPVDGRADLFSAGVLLYELLVGRKPFEAESPTAAVYQIMHTEPAPIRSIAPDLPEELELVVGKALKKSADERYARASEMASDLQMVKMMLDLPLHSGEASGGQQAQSAVKPITGKLHATTVMKPSTAVLNTPMRGSAAAAAADAAPRAGAEERTGKSNLMWLVGAFVVVAAAAVIYLALRGQGTPVTSAPGPNVTGPAGPATPGRPGGPPAPGTVSMIIQSRPAGAHIVVDGKDTGEVTPRAIPMAKAGNVELSLKGYVTLNGVITDADLKTGNKEFTLVRETGPVHLTATGAYPFEIVQGGKVISQSSKKHDLTIQPGGASVSVRNKEFLLDQQVDLDFTRGSRDFSVPGTGTISFIIAPAFDACSVTVDGEDLGLPPVPPKPVAAGAHRVALKCPEAGNNASQTATVSSGENQQVRFTKGVPSREQQ